MPKDAIALLKSDHDKVRELLKELTDSSDRAAKTRKKLLSQIETELKIHTKLEEEIFYPAFKQAGDKQADKMYYEATEEHRAMEELVLPDLLDTETDSVQFSGRAKVLKELVEHHASEEESSLFPAVQEVMTKDQLAELGSQMEDRKRELMAEIAA